MSRGYLEGYSRYEYMEERTASRLSSQRSRKYEALWKDLRKHFREMVKHGVMEVDAETAKLIGLKR